MVIFTIFYYILALLLWLVLFTGIYQGVKYFIITPVNIPTIEDFIEGAITLILGAIATVIMAIIAFIMISSVVFTYKYNNPAIAIGLTVLYITGIFIYWLKPTNKERR